MYIEKILSKRESKYRKKLIAENHYDKEKQRIFDEIIRNSDISYAEIYRAIRADEFGNLRKKSLEIQISVNRLANSFKSLKKAFEHIGVTLNDFKNQAIQLSKNRTGEN